MSDHESTEGDDGLPDAELELGTLRHFTAGTVGPAGARVFYLQASNGGELHTFKLEKGQLRDLAAYMAAQLGGIDPNFDEIAEAPELADPIEPRWVIASIGVAFQDWLEQFVLVIEEPDFGDQPDVDSDVASTVKMDIPVRMARGFVLRANELIQSGRPPCVFCGAPLNEASKWCPCFN